LERLAAPRASHQDVRGAPGRTMADADVAAILRTPTPVSAVPTTRAPEPARAAAPRAPAPSAPAVQMRAAQPPAPSADAQRQPASRTPTGRKLQDFLQNGIAGFGALENTPLSNPAVIPDEEIVPIESLLYRGKAALERARELRAAMLSERTPPRETIEELFDLLDLAIAD
ncbi:MAG TPA: hypothetical protein VIM15_02840, partial [Gemmatimonadaceae bacterium]